MDFNEMINQVLYGLIMIAGSIIVPFLVKYLRARIEESEIVKKLTENENMQNLVKDAINQVLDVVIYVNQTYVDSLKEKGEFTKEAQDEAFATAYAEAARIISEESRQAIYKLYGDVDNWLKKKIEACVNKEKKNPS